MGAHRAGPPDPAATNSVSADRTGHVVQVQELHGSVTFGDTVRSSVGVVAAVLGAGVLVSAAVLVPHWVELTAPPFVVHVERAPEELVRRQVYEPGAVAAQPAPKNNACATPYPNPNSVDRGRSTPSFVISATDRPLRVHGLDLLVEKENGRADGDVIGCEGDMGGPVSTSILRVDLDEGTWEYTYPDPADAVGAVLPPDDSPADFPAGADGRTTPFVLEIAPGRSERVQVFAFAEHAVCRWEVVLALEVDGEEYEHRVDDGGGRFLTYPEDGDYATQVYDYVARAWKRA